MPVVNIAYAANVTEVEGGWGSRPDGIVFSESKEGIEDFQSRMNTIYKGSKDCIVVSDDIVVMQLTEAGVKALEEMAQHGKPFCWVDNYKEYLVKL